MLNEQQSSSVVSWYHYYQSVPTQTLNLKALQPTVEIIKHLHVCNNATRWPDEKIQQIRNISMSRNMLQDELSVLQRECRGVERYLLRSSESLIQEYETHLSHLPSQSSSLSFKFYRVLILLLKRECLRYSLRSYFTVNLMNMNILPGHVTCSSVARKLQKRVIK